MASPLEKLLYAVVGTATITTDKVKELLEDLLQNNEYTEDEGRRVVNSLRYQLEDARATINNRVYVLVDEMLTKLHLPTQDQLKSGADDLKAKVKKPFSGKKGRSVSVR